jgi:putative SOS response-associated peptidase YedK
VAVVRRHPETGARHLDLLKWGLLPYWTKEPTRAQRPIIYEWKVVEGGKQPYAIARQDGQSIAFAGLWESFRWGRTRR